MTLRNILIAIAVLVALGIFIFFVHWSNRSDDELIRGRAPLEGTHKTLQWEHKGLGRMSGKK